MSVINVKQLRSTVGEWTATRRLYVVGYRIQTTDPTISPAVILKSPLVPKLHVTTYGYGGDVDVGAICTRVSIPQRDLNDKSGLIWILEAEYEFDSEKLPPFMPVEIVPFFLSTQTVTQKTLFRGWFKNNETLDFIAEDITDSPVLEKDTTAGPVCNSAGTAVVPTPEQRQSMLGYRVSWTKRTAYNFDGFINTTNQAPYRLFCYDRVINDHDPDPPIIIFDRLFLQNTLLLVDVQTQIQKAYGRNFYRYTLEFHADLKAHLHFELDRGVEVWTAANEDDGRGSRWGPDSIKPGMAKKQRLKDINGENIKDPMLLDGRGRLLDPQEPSGAIYLAFQQYQTSNFANLPIGDTT